MFFAKKRFTSQWIKVVLLNLYSYHSLGSATKQSRFNYNIGMKWSKIDFGPFYVITSNFLKYMVQ